MTDDLKSDRLRDRLAEMAAEAEAEAEATGDERFARAAGVLRGDPAGRRPVDDKAALAYAESLFDAGLVSSRNAACIQAAIRYAPSDNAFDATKARLLRKFLQN